MHLTPYDKLSNYSKSTFCFINFFHYYQTSTNAIGRPISVCPFDNLNSKQSIFFWITQTRLRLYRIFDCRFALFNALSNIDIMQKLLNTHAFALSLLWLRMFSNVKARLSGAFALVLLTGLSNLVMAAPGFNGNSVIISGNGTNTANGTYDVSAFSNTNSLKVLGSFDRSTGNLYFGAQSNTTESGNENVNSVQVLYRVYSANLNVRPTDTSPAFTALPLSTTGTGKNKVWNSTSPVNLINATSASGSYVIEFFFQLNYSTNKIASVLTVDNNSNNNYKATFAVSGTQAATWNGTFGNDWHDGRNWSPVGEPQETTDVNIPYVAGGIYPIVAYNEAKARTLSIQGTPANGIGARLSLSGGELRIFGNFQDPNAGFKQTGGVFTLAGTTQTFDGASFVEVHIEGGGIKTLSNRMDISARLQFTDGILSTRTDNSGAYSVDLGTSATIEGETATSYVLGFLRTPFRNVTTATNSFGGIGVDLTASGGSPGITLVTRLTGFAYTGPAGSEVGTENTSVKRSFTFAPRNSENLNFTLVFHYLDSELNGLTASNLKLERSTTGAAPFENLGSNSSVANMVTTTSIAGTLAATFTLASEPVNPLPVTLISFTATATAQGAALLRWATATETNNRGFGIERQLGTSEAWQSVGFVAAGATTGSKYEFTDKSLVNAPASTQAYYRLRQEDLDGKVTYSPVAAITRTATVAATELTLSPVPVSGSDNLSVGLAEAGQAGIVVAVINTQGQRLMSFTTQASTDGALSLPVTSLAAGVYIVTVQVPGQAARHARFVKL